MPAHPPVQWEPGLSRG